MAKKPKKKSKLLTQAEKLGKSKYAGVLKELALNDQTNVDLYKNATATRMTNADKALGSIVALNAAAKNEIGKQGAETQSLYQQSMAKSQESSANAGAQVAQNSNNMLSMMQQRMKEAGQEGYMDLSPVTAEQTKQQGYLAQQGQAQQFALERERLQAGERTTQMQGLSDMIKTTEASKSRAAADTDISDLYNKWLARNAEIDTATAKTKLEKGDYINQTYLTLKEKAAAEKAAAQQAKLQASIASGNLAYKSEALRVNTQYKYDKLASDVAQKGIENKLKERGFTHSRAIALAKLAVQQSGNSLKWEKFNWDKLNPKASQKINLADLLAAGN